MISCRHARLSFLSENHDSFPSKGESYDYKRGLAWPVLRGLRGRGCVSASLGANRDDNGQYLVHLADTEYRPDSLRPPLRAQTEFGKPLVDSTFTLALVTGQSVIDI